MRGGEPVDTVTERRASRVAWLLASSGVRIEVRADLPSHAIFEAVKPIPHERLAGVEYPAGTLFMGLGAYEALCSYVAGHDARVAREERWWEDYSRGRDHWEGRFTHGSTTPPPPVPVSRIPLSEILRLLSLRASGT